MSIAENYDIKKIASWWDTDIPYTPATQWTEIPRIQRNLNFRGTDDYNLDWITFSERFFAHVPKPRQALSIGCGTGIIERILRQRDICQSIDATDLSEESIKKAKQSAQTENLDGINYWSADLHTIKLPAEKYDVVYAHAILHHVFQLEYVIEQIRQSLKPDGILVVYEYTGPSHMQFPKPIMELADVFLQAIPQNFRKSIVSGNYKEQAPRLSLQMFQETDPSEGVRAAEVVPQVATRFEVRHFRNLGGTILMQILNEIAGNFIQDDPIVTPILEAMIYTENFLIDTGVLPSYHAYMICQKTANPIPMQTQDIIPSFGLRPRLSPAEQLNEPIYLETLTEIASTRLATAIQQKTFLEGQLAERESRLEVLRTEQAKLLLELGRTQQWAQEMEQRLQSPSRIARLFQLLRRNY
jgi:2-polyprenyl-3-methyl-5-hydroxy-6-metoxy-1,4-benzoquinol methylase